MYMHVLHVHVCTYMYMHVLLLVNNSFPQGMRVKFDLIFYPLLGILCSNKVISTGKLRYMHVCLLPSYCEGNAALL